jgi:uncharacterized membrane protein
LRRWHLFRYWGGIFWESLKGTIFTVWETPAGIAWSVVVLFLTILWLWRKHGWTGMRAAFWTTVGEGLLIAFVAFVLVFLWRFINRPYEHWKAENEQVKALEQEKKSLEAELEKERDRNSPKFELSWAAATAGNATFIGTDGSKSQFSDFYLQIGVLNHGAPSVIKEWKGLARFNDGTIVEGQLLVGSQKNIHVRMHGQELPLEPQLIPTWSVIPIPTGGRAVGSVIFKLPAGLKEKLEMQGAAFVVKLWDISGREYLIEIPYAKVAESGLPAGLTPSLPGMGNP